MTRFQSIEALEPRRLLSQALAYRGDGDQTQEAGEFYAPGITITDDSGDPLALANGQMSFTVNGLAQEHSLLRVVANIEFMQFSGDGVDIDRMTLTAAGMSTVAEYLDEFSGGGFYDSVIVIPQHAATSVDILLGGTDWEYPEYVFLHSFEVYVILPDVSVLAHDGVATEGANPVSDVAVARFTRSADSLSQDVIVEYTVTDETTSASDYAALSGQVTILAGQTFADVIIAPTDDSTPEWTERLIIEVTDAYGYAVAPAAAEAVFEIVDGDLFITGLPSDLEINNDDDDDNDVIDKDQSGSVAGEDDLYAVQLDFPQEVKYSATVTLSAPNDKVRAWQNADRSGAQYITAQQSSYTWTIGQETPPTTVYVEAVAGSATVGDIQLALAASDALAAAPSTQPTTTQAATSQGTARGVDLRFRGNNLGRDGKAGSVVVGERIKVEAIPLGPGGNATYSWDVPEKRIETWSPQAGPNGQNSQVVDLTRLNESDVQFHWVDAADSRTVTVTGTNGGRDFLGRLRFRVLRPAAGFISAKRQTIVSPLWDGAPGNDALHLGNDDENNPNTAGVYFKASVQDPQFVGDLQWVQTIDGFRREHRIADNKWYRATHSGLDGDYPYRGGGEMGDSPGKRLNQAAFSETEVSESFVSWAMYRPANSPDGDSVWVSLLKVSWSWGGKAQWNGQQWDLVAGSAIQPDPQKEDTTDYPQWGNVVVTPLSYQIEQP